MAAKPRAALGFKVHTGWTAVVALRGEPRAPELVGKARIQVAFTFEEGAVYHAGQELPVDEARALIEDSEARFTKTAKEQLAAFTEQVGHKIVGAGMAAAPVKQLPPLETILKAHPLVHTAEGELYRRVFAEAARAAGPRPERVPEKELPGRVAAAAKLKPAAVDAHLAGMGKASGRPWTADQKHAALAAWLALLDAAE